MTYVSLFLAGLMSRNWNAIYPSLYLMHKKLNELGAHKNLEGSV